MRIGLVEFLLILAIASLTIGPQVALFVDRWLRRANRVNARAARRRAEYAAQAAAERDALLKRFRTASTVFGVCILLALVICFGITPLFNQSISQKAEIVRVTKDIKEGNEIPAEMVQTVEVGAYNLPQNLMTDKKEVVGKYATADLAAGSSGSWPSRCR